MLPDQIQEIADAPEVQDLRYRLAFAGAKDKVIRAAINSALSNIGNPGYREGVRIVTGCLLEKLREYERERQPKTWFGKLIKTIFG